jgi:hypothetical protein
VRIQRNNVKETRRDDGIILRSYQDIEVEAKEIFEELYTKNVGADPEITTMMIGNIPSLITSKENVDQKNEIIEEEIINAKWGLESDKSLGSDGFTIHFY